MEHRWSERAAVPVSVTVYSRGTELLRTVTRNLSRQGALLHGDGADLGSARSVELDFELGHGKRRHQVRMAAYVIHRSGGIGLMFTEQSTAAVRDLERLLRASRSSSAQA